MDWRLLGEFLFLLVSAISVAAILERFKINAVVGYLVAGMLVGPSVLELVGVQRNPEAFAVMAELGVSLLLFTIGLEITPGKLKLFGVRGGVLGICQVVFTVLLVMPVIWLLNAGGNFGLPTVFAAACCVTMSSTAVAARVLGDRHELEAPHGRDALSVLLLQDLAVVPMIIIISMLGTSSLDEVPEEAVEASQTTDIFLLVTLGSLLFATVLMLPKMLGSTVFRRNRDFPVIIALGSALTAAWASHAVGLSAELGAFVAGIGLARTEFAHQLRADVQAWKAVFLTLFFASVGLLADLGWVFSDFNWVWVILFTATGILLKTFIIASILVLMGSRISRGVRVGLCLAQIGEFSFVILSIALARDLLQYDGFQMGVSATVLSLMLTPLLIVYSKPIGIAVESGLRSIGFRLKDSMDPEEVPRRRSGHVVIGGYGPAGEETTKTLHLAQIETFVLDLNPRLVENAREQGSVAMIGNCSQRENLEHADLASARALVVTIPDPETALATIEHARVIAPELIICARVRFRKYVEIFEMAGADHVVSEEGVVGTLLGSMVVSILVPDEDEQEDEHEDGALADESSDREGAGDHGTAG
ncbi:MAG: cation:proton antiporter [Planctomycetota bacterium]|nr:cation:proton antiporter [Planctomycetota bacterium]MEC8733856.1 cation:proton antiporter [Planctomycetota bacterium]MEC9158651.1 cation:proton antiporter [Planctomycetota bacterium]